MWPNFAYDGRSGDNSCEPTRAVVPSSLAIQHEACLRQAKQQLKTNRAGVDVCKNIPNSRSMCTGDIMS